MTSQLSEVAFQRIYKSASRALAKLKAKADVLAPDQYREATILQGQLQATLPDLLEQLKSYRLSATPIEGLREGDMQDSLDLLDDHLMELQLLLSSLAHRDDPVTMHTSTLPSRICNNSVSQVQLPQLQLEAFDGSLASWDSFYAKFLCLVDQNDTLSAVHKFHYLLTALGAEGKHVIEHLPVSEANYPVALQLLHNRFHNKRRVIAYHVQNILALPPVRGESALSLRQFIDNLMSNYEALKAMPNIDYKDAIITSFLLSKLDPALIKRFERTTTEEGFPSVAGLIHFLTYQAKLEENSALHQPASPIKGRSIPSDQSSSQRKRVVNSVKTAYCTTVSRATSKPTSRRGTTVATASWRLCSMCHLESHRLCDCPQMMGKTPRERFQWITETQRCVVCLGKHSSATCSNPRHCFTCNARHHTLLHFGPPPATTSANIKSPQLKTSSPPAGSSALISHTLLPHSCLMATTLVRLEVSPSQYIIVRAVVDTAAAASFLSNRCVRALSPPQTRNSVPVVGVGETNVKTLGTTQLSIAQINGKIITQHHPFLILSSITQPSPTYQISPTVKRALSGQVLADPSFDMPAPIDCILGADLAAQVIIGPPRILGPDLPYLLPTVFGAVIMGNAPTLEPVNPPPVCNLLCLAPVAPISCLSATVDLNSLIQTFWALEEPPPLRRTIPPVDTAVESFFCNTTTRDSSGRYQVRLPFNTSTHSLGDSYAGAKRRFLALERKLQADPSMRSKYIDFMRDYEGQGHMVQADGPQQYFIPHHGVFKGEASDSKIRVVFDASAKTSTGAALNDLLHKGPSLHTLISDIITLFREHPYVFSCDIRQMYRQINLHPQDFPYQCILWRESPTAPLLTYYLVTVTYGVSSSPYLALRTLKQLAMDEGAAYPAAALALQSQIFVDDIVGGATELDTVVKLRDEIIQLLAKGGFSLRKWASNHPALYADLRPEHCLLESPPRILGLAWDAEPDVLSVTPPLISAPSFSELPVTKRHVLAIIASIYDPCGWVAPVTTTAKVFLQRLWLQPLDWDTPLPDDLAETWTSYAQQLATVNSFQVCRPLTSGPATYELHGFCDASCKAYAAVIYLRRITSSSLSTSLVASKTRVAPIRTITIPRLELCGALLLSTLMQHYSSLLNVAFNPRAIFLWTDSTIVLSWLRMLPNTLKIFVANRVTQIQDATPTAIWRHVPTQDNPADLASRGMLPHQLGSADIWWNGPAWLTQPDSSWPSLPPVSTVSSAELELIDQGPTACIAHPQEEIPCWPSWSKLYRFIYKCLCWRNRAKNQLVSYAQVINAICYTIQRSSFANELRLLEGDKPVNGRLSRLSPFLDSHGLIRVGGRIRTSTGLKSTHPILLPKVHPWVDLLIDHYHVIYAHAGPTLLQYNLTQQFWILAARQRIRHRLFKCIRCFRARPRVTQPKMGNLPLSRVTPAPPFHHTGMDYCGPFTARASQLRRAAHVKIYLCIFICFTSKAVHLEVAQDLSTNAFLDVLQRFISRRGAPLQLYSDCGTNFVGAARKLQGEVQRIVSEGTTAKELQSFTQTQGIQFNFNPPAAPHQGGLWERMVRSAKHHLTRVIGVHIPTVSEFTSLTIRIEAILNSRPLTPMSSDPSDLQALTPAHFLIGRPLTALPMSNVDTPTNPVLHSQRIAAFINDFWRQWRREYLPTLQARQKWTKDVPNLRVNDLVVLEEPNVPPLTWPLGRIEEVFTGSDGVVRSVQVRTPTGVYKRPSIKVFRLPILE